MNRPLIGVVLAGGIGSRLYPASRSHRPKQFLALDGERSLLARTVERAAFVDHLLVVTREAYAEQARDHAEAGIEAVADAELASDAIDAPAVGAESTSDSADAPTGDAESASGSTDAPADATSTSTPIDVPTVDVLVEPAGRDTGPALLYATHEADERFADPVVLALPSDHHVAGDFASVGRRAARAAVETDALAAVGIEPTRPETGYGYIEPGAERGDGAYYEAAAFHEKPDAETATRYVDAGHLWNAGIFAWTPAALRREARDSPLAPLAAALEDGDPRRGFERVEAVSVDYAVMERAESVVVVPADVAWDDLGAWDALARIDEADADGNVALGEALTVDAADNVIVSDDKHVSLVGVEDLAVVAWDDRVLVVPKADAQRVREVVAQLRAENEF